MAKSLTWRWLLIIVIVAGWIYSMIPPTDRDFYETLNKEANKGTQQVDERFTKMVDRAKELMAEKDIAKRPASELGAVEKAAAEQNVKLNQYIEIHGQPNPTNKAVLEYVHRLASGKFRLGLDLKGGTEFTIAFNPDDIPEGRKASDVRDQIIEIIRNRVDAIGVLEPEIMPLGDNQVIVRVPTTNDEERNQFRELIKRSANLTFHIVNPKNQELVAQERERQQDNPAFQLTVPGYDRKVFEDVRNGEPVEEILFIRKQPEAVSGKNLTDAFPTPGEFGGWQISFKFDTKGAVLFGETTTKHQGERMAIVLDGQIYGAPNIEEPITGGSGVIRGNFTRDEATQLAVAMRCGNLPVKIRIEGEMSTNPTLGLASVKAGAYAGIAGILLVVVFMLCYYLFSGIIANIALLLNVVLLMGTLPILDATITLPGLAGIILTVGMAVDANVLIFERIREELNTGKSVANAISRGYASAFSTILDANLTTLLTAVILIKFGSGPIKGFGVTLSIGIMASMFTALFVTRTIYDTLLHLNLLKSNLKMLQLFKMEKVPFLRYTRLFVTISLVLIGLALATFAVRGKGLLGVDFRGGTALNYQYKQEVQTKDIVKMLEEQTEVKMDQPRVHYKNASVADKEGNLLEIVVGNTFEAEHEGEKPVDVAKVIEKQLQERFPQAGFSAGNLDQIGALVGKRFAMKAIYSMFWALVVIVIYISFRFELSYALGAVVALMHDVTIGAGVFLMWNLGARQISLPVIAALLTIIGYSLNDTIVVFDRIRENVGLLKNKTLREISEISINQTMSRTVLTSGTTLVVVITLYLFGGGAINDFALIMLLGIVVGTYSSIFIATPVMLWWTARTTAAHERAREAAAAAARHKSTGSATV